MDAAIQPLSDTRGRLMPAAVAGMDGDWLNHAACRAVLENYVYERNARNEIKIADKILCKWCEELCRI